MNMDVRYEAKKWSEKIVCWLAWHLPEYLVYWCSIRVLAFATTGVNSKKMPGEINILDVIEAWRTKNDR